MFIVEKEEKKEKKNWLKWLLTGVVIFLALLIMLGFLYIYFENKYENLVYPGVKINDLNLSGKTYEEARSAINQKVNNLYQDGIYFDYKDKKIKLEPIVSSAEGTWSYQIIDFDIDQTAKDVYLFGRSGNFFNDIFQKTRMYLSSDSVLASHRINDEYFEKFLQDNFSEFEIPAKSANLIATTSPEGEMNFNIEKEKMGVIFDYEKAKENLKKNLDLLKTADIQLSTVSSYPKVYEKDCLNVEQKAENILALSPFYIHKDKKEWKITKDQVADWLSLDEKNNEVVLSFDENKLNEYLKTEIAEKIDVEPIDARFEINNGKVSEFQGSRDGYQVNIASSSQKIINDFLHEKATSTELVFNITKSTLKTSETNDLGITEIIGTGHSNFAGSPANRRHNIKTGAGKLNGIIIKPDEEFSLVKTLGPVDGTTGYLPELVIKENKTIPEYGGGLCQVATTLFRTAIQSGLPITERRNHSYRVSYYEPAGTDAAIYIPHPDVRFKNDTGNNILIQIRFSGDDLYFDFWGTKDGRKVTVTDPVIYNITYPGPTKIIETTELEPEVKRCTESAHNGADAYFDYKVEYSDSEKENIEERFTSHYVPWRAVCFVGVEELSEDKEGSEETSDAKSGEENNSENQNSEEKNISNESNIEDNTEDEIKIENLQTASST